jgi:hypothetical protein
MWRVGVIVGGRCFGGWVVSGWGVGMIIGSGGVGGHAGIFRAKGAKWIEYKEPVR